MNPRITRILGLVVFFFGSFAAAQEKKEAAPVPRRRIESVTLDPVARKLTWIVATSSPDESGKFVPASTKSYEIDLAAATMTFEGETRGFERQEADEVLSFLRAFQRYTVDSVLWWEAGKGEKLEKKAAVGKSIR